MMQIAVGDVVWSRRQNRNGDVRAIVDAGTPDEHVVVRFNLCDRYRYELYSRSVVVMGELEPAREVR